MNIHCKKNKYIRNARIVKKNLFFTYHYLLLHPQLSKINVLKIYCGPVPIVIGSYREEQLENKILKIYCGVEQLVARWAHNPKVIGSSPVPATKKKPDTKVSGFFIIFVSMFTIYVLYSSKHQKIYIGFTSDLKNRLISHNVFSKKGLDG